MYEIVYINNNNKIINNVIIRRVLYLDNTKKGYMGPLYYYIGPILLYRAHIVL